MGEIMGDVPDLDELLANGMGDSATKAKSSKTVATTMDDTTSIYKMLSMADIDPDPEQPRSDAKEANIDELKAQIEEAGLAQPIAVRPIDNRYRIIYGERRYLAVKELGWSHIPALIRKKPPENKVKDQQLLENIGHESMNVMDEALAVASYIRRHKVASYREAGRRLGKSETWVSQRMDLLQLEERDQDLVRRGGMTIGVASTKVRAEAGRLREGSVAHETALAHGFKPREDRLPSTKSTGLSGPSGTSGKPIPRPAPAPPPKVYSKVVVHFTGDHPLAVMARRRCAKEGAFDRNKHAMKVGMIACGACWEAEIRNDERNNGGQRE